MKKDNILQILVFQNYVNANANVSEWFYAHLQTDLEFFFPCMWYNLKHKGMHGWSALQYWNLAFTWLPDAFPTIVVKVSNLHILGTCIMPSAYFFLYFIFFFESVRHICMYLDAMQWNLIKLRFD